MNKTLTLGMAALIAAGSVAASAAPAAAHDGYGGGYGYHNDNDASVAIAGGLIGLALGAAIVSSHHDDYGGAGYGYGYGYAEPAYRAYSPAYGAYGAGYSGYGEDYGYRQCVTHRTIWDPYAGGYVVQRLRYAC